MDLFNKRFLHSLALIAGLTLFLTGCGDDDDDDNNDDNDDDVTLTLADVSADLKTQVVENYATNVYNSYVDALEDAQDLQTAINTFITAPSDANFQAARQAWLDAREVYGQTEAYRFYDGPIDVEPGGPEGDLNSWPMDESFVDYVVDISGQTMMTGIVNSTDEISETALREANAADEEEVEVTIGYHAIEFLLWGQDATATSTLQTGLRQFTDYTTLANADRRGQYLQLVMSLLLDDLQILVDAWAPSSSDNFRATFVADPDAAIASMFTGIGTLSRAELGGERMDVALVNHDQEDEHSCFSDNTHRDILNNALGIQNVYLGNYGSNNGPGLDEVVAAVNETLNSTMTAELTATMTAVAAIDSQQPFDFLISAENTAGNAVVQTAIDALDAQTTTIELIANALDITISLEL